MQTKSEKYLHMVTTNRPGKWLSIGLTNVVDGMSKEQLVALLPLAQAAIAKRAKAAYDKLVALQVGDLILDIYRKELEKAESGNHPHVAIIRRQIKKAW